MQHEIIIGIEVHAQLNTKSKLFSGAATQFGATPNSQACLFDLGFPGTLPTLNKEAVYKAIKLGFALHGNIKKHSVFSRKNYFYPDLPKGYQTTQYHLPIIEGGFIDIALNNKKTKRINITRIQLEEDSGKLLHDNFNNKTGIDFNRAGVPLIEVISEPDLRSAEEAVAYLKKLHALLIALDVCDGKMHEGSFRADVNLSVRPFGQKTLNTRTEIKNLNSFRFVKQAIQYESQRQITAIQKGEKILQETRFFDSHKKETFPLREKESLKDYRYFPEPDLPPLNIPENIIQEIRQSLSNSIEKSVSSEARTSRDTSSPTPSSLINTKRAIPFTRKT